ncbi:MAG: NADH-quinone oxidoreductase subunit NuoE [Bacillota bacterium]|nr:NADH-quinone oxidoreductase subunit NuoE [Bacillota bacterium]
MSAVALKEQELKQRLEPILVRHGRAPSGLIPIMQDIQAEFGYLPREAVEEAAQWLKIPVSKAYGVITFYAQFHLKPRGKHVLRVCLGTACHVRGGEKVLEAVSKELGVAPGDTTPDLKFTLERVACLGCCGLAPTMMVDDQTFARLNAQKVKEVLAQFADS